MPRTHKSRSIWRLALPLLLVAVYLGGGCSGLRERLGNWVDKTFGSTSPRQEFVWNKPYAEEVMADWDSAYRLTMTDSLRVRLPHRERFSGNMAPLASAHSLHLRLPPGRVLEVAAETGVNSLVFGELYRIDGDNRSLIAHWDTLGYRLTYETDRPGGEDLLLVVQAAPYRKGGYEIVLSSRSALLFPVAGKDERAIKSFWGASRDGGSRAHEGNDIFADRGTPLLAVSAGRVTRVRDGGLGGKTVWLRDADRPLNYYYAHLDSQLVRQGQYVKRGDTLGLTGNTGNARTTAPHLHFGIYQRGARDPYPYLRKADDPPNAVVEVPGAVSRVPSAGRHYLRTSPERDRGNIIRRLEGGEALVGYGSTGRYHRVRTDRGEVGYVNFE